MDNTLAREIMSFYQLGPAMTYSASALEFDIRARTRWFAEVLAAQSNVSIDMAKIVGDVRGESSQAAPPADLLSWFALERLSQKTGFCAIRMEDSGQSIAGASLVWVSPNIVPNSNDAAALSRAELVVCSDEWESLIREAKIQSARPRRAP